MSGFSAPWLALREPVDHRSLNEAVREAALEGFDGHDIARILDLGCGSGSNLRAMAAFLPRIQEWRLVDHDAALLAAAASALQAWADAHEFEADGALRLEKHGKTLFATFELVDISAGVAPLLRTPVDLVTAAAFFDLVSPAWIEAFALALIEREIPLYATLTYDGVEVWRPQHAADAPMLEAFRAHQASDKGFGAAAGPDAIDCLTTAFRAAEWEVQLGQSAWILGAADAALIDRLALGSAEAVRETGRVGEAEIADWLASRRRADACVIGHTDFMARPMR